MNKALIAALAWALIAGSAMAADLPSFKAPPPPSPPPPLWTGFYVGLNAGYAWGTTTSVANTALPLWDGVALAANNFDPANVVAGRLINGGAALANTGTANVNQNGFIGGGQVGYNYQWGSRTIIGIEADIQGTAVRGSGGSVGAWQDSIQWNDGPPPGLFPCGPAINCILSRTALGSGQVSARVDWMGTVRGRLGFLFTPTMMVYGTGGLAYGGVQASAFHSATTQGTLSGLNPPFNVFNGALALPTIPGVARYSNTRVGWTAGGGFEWMFWPNWSLKAEALYYDLGAAEFGSSPIASVSPITLVVPPIGGATGLAVNAGQVLIASAPVTRVRFDGVIARAGLNYHFNWGAAPW
jgi:outer membrane immunogenic protein